MCRRFTCNVCDLMNEVPVDYYAGIDMATGRRTDEAQRPELSFGSNCYILLCHKTQFFSHKYFIVFLFKQFLIKKIFNA